eukprot:4683107-Prymnesium_polylepis.1
MRAAVTSRLEELEGELLAELAATPQEASVTPRQQPRTAADRTATLMRGTAASTARRLSTPQQSNAARGSQTAGRTQTPRVREPAASRGSQTAGRSTLPPPSLPPTPAALPPPRPPPPSGWELV